MPARKRHLQSPKKSGSSTTSMSSSSSSSRLSHAGGSRRKKGGSSTSSSSNTSSSSGSTRRSGAWTTSPSLSPKGKAAHPSRRRRRRRAGSSKASQKPPVSRAMTDESLVMGETTDTSQSMSPSPESSANISSLGGIRGLPRSQARDISAGHSAGIVHSQSLDDTRGSQPSTSSYSSRSPTTGILSSQSRPTPTRVGGMDDRFCHALATAALKSGAIDMDSDPAEQVLRSKPVVIIDEFSHNIVTKMANDSAHSKPEKDDLYKTELCREWNANGYCYYNRRCSFAHGKRELRPIFRSEKWRTKRCKNFHSQGWCPYAHRCQFLHDQQPIRQGEQFADAAEIEPNQSDPNNYASQHHRRGHAHSPRHRMDKHSASVGSSPMRPASSHRVRRLSAAVEAASGDSRAVMPMEEVLKRQAMASKPVVYEDLISGEVRDSGELVSSEEESSESMLMDEHRHRVVAGEIQTVAARMSAQSSPSKTDATSTVLPSRKPAGRVASDWNHRRQPSSFHASEETKRRNRIQLTKTGVDHGISAGTGRVPGSSTSKTTGTHGSSGHRSSSTAGSTSSKRRSSKTMPSVEQFSWDRFAPEATLNSDGGLNVEPNPAAATAMNNAAAAAAAAAAANGMAGFYPGFGPPWTDDVSAMLYHMQMLIANSALYHPGYPPMAGAMAPSLMSYFPFANPSAALVPHLAATTPAAATEQAGQATPDHHLHHQPQPVYTHPMSGFDVPFPTPSQSPPGSLTGSPPFGSVSTGNSMMGERFMKTMKRFTDNPEGMKDLLKKAAELNPGLESECKKASKKVESQGGPVPTERKCKIQGLQKHMGCLKPRSASPPGESRVSKKEEPVTGSFPARPPAIVADHSANENFLSSFVNRGQWSNMDSGGSPVFPMVSSPLSTGEMPFQLPSPEGHSDLASFNFIFGHPFDRTEASPPPMFGYATMLSGSPVGSPHGSLTSSAGPGAYPSLSSVPSLQIPAAAVSSAGAATTAGPTTSTAGATAAVAGAGAMTATDPAYSGASFARKSVQ